VIDNEIVTRSPPDSRRDWSDGDQFFQKDGPIAGIGATRRNDWVMIGQLCPCRRLRSGLAARIIWLPAEFEKRISRANRMAQQELSEAERIELRRQIERLREEHRDLDVAIEALTQAGAADRLQMQRIKKRKLALRDRLAMLEDMTTPDIIA
jgi:hypothetical protein